MVRIRVTVTLYIKIAIAVLLFIAAPNSAFAKLYWTNTGTVTATAASDTQINVAAPYTTGTTSCANGADGAAQFYCEWATDTGFTTNYGRYPTSGYEVDPDSDLNSTWEYSITGLSCGTSYYVRVIYSDPDGVNSCSGADATVNASTWPVSTNACPAADTTVGTVTSGAQTSSSITLTATLTGDGDNDGYCEFYYNTTNNYPSATLSTACNNVTGASAGADRTCEITGLNASTSYYLWAKYIDPDGVTGGPEVAVTGAPISTSADNGTTTGSVSSTAQTTTSITVTATLTGDANNSGYCEFYYNTSNDFGTATLSSVCNNVTGASAGADRTCEITGLNSGTTYYIWANYIDSADGVTGTNPVQIGTSSVNTLGACQSVITACSDCHGMPPVDWVSGPADGTTGHQGDHGKTAHTGDGARDKCARCHFNYAAMTNVTSAARWTFAHYNNTMDIYTSNNVGNNIYASPYEKGIKGGYYKGYRANSLIFDGNTPGANNVCTATYCHGAGDSPIWGSGSAACGSCHSVPPPGTAGKHTTHNNGFVGYKNNSNSTTYDFGCYKCHDPASHAGGPVSSVQAAPVAFDNVSAPLNPSGSYTAGGSAAGTDGVYNWTNGTCSSTYCHSNGAGSNVTNPTWNGGALGCTGCHNGLKADDPSHMQSGKHAEHINNALPNLASFTCDECHNATTTTGNTITDKSKHVNGTPNVAFDSTNPSGGFATPNCSNLYCHSSGQATPTYRTGLSWSAGTLGCNGCHGADNFYTDVNGSPDYENVSTASRNSFNGHYVSAHVSAATDCIKCHNSTVDATGAIKASSAHLDGTPTVDFSVSGTYANKRCSGTASSCHGSLTPRWGGTLTCEDCHFNTGAIGNETQDTNYVYDNGTKTEINKTEWENAGHGRTSGSYPWTQNSAANKVCTDCHTYSVDHGMSSNPFRLISSASIRPTNNSTLCLSCHDGVTALAAEHHNSTNVSAVYPSANATWTFTPKCVDCHDPHGDTDGQTASEYNGAMIQSKVASSGSNAYGVPSGTPVNMDFPDDDPATNVDFNYASFQQADYSGICQVCHDASDNVVNYNKTTNNTSHYTGQGKCTSCHGHDAGFGPSGGTCKGCHGTGGSGTSANRENIETALGKTSHHINATWANIADTTCEVCHLEGGNTADGSPDAAYHNNNVGGNYPVDLRVIVTVGASESATITNSSNQTAAQFFTGTGDHGGTRSAEYTANNHCLGCHDQANETSNPFNGSESGGGILSPGTYDGNKGSVDERYSQTGTTTSHPYDPASKNVVPDLNKAYSPHGRPDLNQMKNVVSGAWSDDSQTSANAIGCLDCHNSHGSSACDDASSFNGITYNSNVGGYKGGLLKETSGYNPAETSTYSVTADLCFDCHINTGSGTDATAPKTANDFGVAATRNVHEYYDAGRWTSSDTWSPTFSYKTGGTGNGSGSMKGSHFGASSALTNSASGINGNCNSCHDPHGTPFGDYVGTGTNRSRMAPALRGAWMSSPYKEDRVPSSTVTDTNSYGATIASDGSGDTARIAPTFSLNNPADLGAGFGTGNSSFGTYAAGGSGAGGYFIDDNTFGNTFINSNTQNPWRDDGAISATYIGQTAADFGGLCLGCHTEANLKAISYSNGTDTIKVHNTVAGWYSAANAADLFKNTHASQHSMAYYMPSGTTSNRCTSAYWTIPAGYRWSVNPGSQTALSQTGSWDDITSQMTHAPHDNGGQTTSGYKQSAFHQFPCAKCHAPHASKLPRLMKTNCLDVGEGNVSEGGNPGHNTGYAFSGCDDGTDTVDKKPMICHGMGPGGTGAGNTSNTSNDGGWNIKTGW